MPPLSSLSHSSSPFTPRRIVATCAVVFVMLSLLICSSSLWEHLDAGEIMVRQHPISGNLTVFTTPGVKWQGFGSVTKYRKRDQFWFSPKHNGDALKTRFNDGAHADITGSIAWEMPLDESHLIELHSKYGSMDAIEQQLIRTVVQKSVYMTGPLMASAESYAARRNDLLSLIDDQIRHGVYSTSAHDDVVTDELTGSRKTVRKVDLIASTDPVDFGHKRESVSPLESFGINIIPGTLSLDEVDYDETVEAQIQKQQEAIMQVQTAIATARMAEQKALTVEKEGQALAASAKWEQEVKNATINAEAEQRNKTATLDLKTAELKKQATILLAEGEAQSRKMVMDADGALEKKLQAYIEVNRVYAEAMAKYQGAWVPAVMMGAGDGAAPQNGAMDFINLLAVKAAKDLAIDLSIESKTAVAAAASK